MAKTVCLSTITKAGRPTARIVMLRDFDDNGFVFTTNVNSRKAKELIENPFASLTFHWRGSRQVRIEGAVTRITFEETKELFSKRARDAQIGEWVSEDLSGVIADVDAAASAAAKVRKRFEGVEPIPCPPFFTGFRIACDSIEFWEGSNVVGKAHERILYESEEGGEYRPTRLCP
ncbi:UNVERIFIED_CONTAM: hypothetical protein HDU68_005339 [Siphonaria sp. JEL0065]|nr:hypothetical protein HDU68_005339 [Siphonaria sp. JEL0065]